MANTAPYTYYTCPCSEVPTAPSDSTAASSAESPEDEDRTLDPYHPRSAYALYPLSDLLFCNECHEIRCPRCSFQEVMYYYCPGCLLETPSTTIKQESNCCTRSCTQCPLCTAPLQLQSFPDPSRAANASQHHSEKNGPFILSCPFCAYSTLDIDVTLDKSINVISQLRKHFSPGSKDADDLDLPPAPANPDTRRTSTSRLVSSTSIDDVFAPSQPTSSRPSGPPSPVPDEKPVDPFDALSSFYRTQLDTTQPAGPFASLSSTYGLDSPSQLSRLLSTYGVGALKKQRGRLPTMREALFPSEGLLPAPTPQDEADTLAALESAAWDGTASRAQQAAQLTSSLASSTLAPRLTPALRPVPLPLRSKRAKRCGACRHFLVRPDEKRQGALRFKIRLLALTYVPALVASPLAASFLSTPGLPLAPAPASPAGPGPAPTHVLLTFRNPRYEAVQITLATPGRQAASARRARHARVTLLCPSFEVGATADAWSEALEGVPVAGRPEDGAVPEAGKVWSRGRNWTGVVMEIVAEGGGGGEDEGGMEVPIFVRMEYEAEEAGEGAGYAADARSRERKEKGDKGGKVKRELAYWCVVGVGRVE